MYLILTTEIFDSSISELILGFMFKGRHISGCECNQEFCCLGFHVQRKTYK